MPEIIGTVKRKGIAWRKSGSCSYDFNYQDEGWDSFISSPPASGSSKKSSFPQDQSIQKYTSSSSLDRVVILSQTKNSPYNTRRRRCSDLAVTSLPRQKLSSHQSSVSVLENELIDNNSSESEPTDDLQRSLVQDVTILDPLVYFLLKSSNQNPVISGRTNNSESLETHSRSDNNAESIPSSISKKCNQRCSNTTKEKCENNSYQGANSNFSENNTDFSNVASAIDIKSIEFIAKNIIEASQEEKVLEHMSDETVLKSNCLGKESSYTNETSITCDEASLTSSFQSKINIQVLQKDKRSLIDSVAHDLQVNDTDNSSNDFHNNIVDKVAQDVDVQKDSSDTSSPNRLLSDVAKKIDNKLSITGDTNNSGIVAGEESLGKTLPHSEQNLNDPKISSQEESGLESNTKDLTRLERRRHRRRLRKRKRLRSFFSQEQHEESMSHENKKLEKPYTSTTTSGESILPPSCRRARFSNSVVFFDIDSRYDKHPKTSEKSAASISSDTLLSSRNLNDVPKTSLLRSSFLGKKNVQNSKLKQFEPMEIRAISIDNVCPDTSVLNENKTMTTSNFKAAGMNSVDFVENHDFQKDLKQIHAIGISNEASNHSDSCQKSRVLGGDVDSETKESKTSSEWNEVQSKDKHLLASNQTYSESLEMPLPFPVQSILSRVERRRQRRRLRKRKRLRTLLPDKTVDTLDNSCIVLPSEQSYRCLRHSTVPITNTYLQGVLFTSFKNAIQKCGYVDQYLFCNEWSGLHHIRFRKRFCHNTLVKANDKCRILSSVRSKSFELSNADALTVGQLKWEAALLELINECHPQNNRFPSPVEIRHEDDNISLIVEIEKGVIIFGTLAEFLQWYAFARHGMIPEPVVASLVLDIIEITKALHRIGIAHNNLGLETFLVGMDGSRLFLILNGLGCKSRILSTDKITHHFHHDMFSVAFITWTLLTGCIPFEFVATIEGVQIEGIHFLSNNIFLKARNEWKNLIHKLMKLSSSHTISMNNLQDCVLHPLRKLIETDTLNGRIDIQEFFSSFWSTMSSNVKNWDEISFAKSISISSEELIFHLQLHREVSQPQRHTSAMLGTSVDFEKWIHSPVESNTQLSKERLVTDNDDDDNYGMNKEDINIDNKDLSLTVQMPVQDSLTSSPLQMHSPESNDKENRKLYDKVESRIESSSSVSKIIPSKKNSVKKRPCSIPGSDCSFDYDTVSVDSLFKGTQVIPINPGNPIADSNGQNQIEMIVAPNSSYIEDNMESFEFESESRIKVFIKLRFFCYSRKGCGKSHW
jgi:hypothetical protein